MQSKNENLMANDELSLIIKFCDTIDYFPSLEFSEQNIGAFVQKKTENLKLLEGKYFTFKLNDTSSIFKVEKQLDG